MFVLDKKLVREGRFIYHLSEHLVHNQFFPCYIIELYTPCFRLHCLHRTMNDEVQYGDQEMMGDIQHETTLTDEYLQSPHSAASLAAAEEGGMTDKPLFTPLSAQQMNGGVEQYARVNVPPNRYTPLKNQWMDIYNPIVQHMKLNIRFDPKKRAIELKTCELTESAAALQKSADFCKAFCLGFEIRDAIALLRLDDLYIDSYVI